ncbi:MAG: RHS repeat-associated core domain-containing protein [Candidatus Acidiferrum sp.]
MTECVDATNSKTSGASYYRARYYDPSAGRLLSEDPINLGGGPNFYDYVQNEPVGGRVDDP